MKPIVIFLLAVHATAVMDASRYQPFVRLVAHPGRYIGEAISTRGVLSGTRGMWLEDLPRIHFSLNDAWEQVNALGIQPKGESQWRALRAMEGQPIIIAGTVAVWADRPNDVIDSLVLIELEWIQTAAGKTVWEREKSEEGGEE